MTCALIWSGPVYADTPNKVQWSTDVEVIPITGNGSSWFSSYAAKMTGPDGRILPQILASVGKQRSDYDKVAIAGFSAAHGLYSPLLGADGDSIDAAILIDSCFSAMGSPAKTGYASFARRAGAGERLMVLTIGPGGGPGSGATISPDTPDFSSATDCAMASTASAGTFSPYTPPDGLPPEQAQALRCGGCILLPYLEYRHDQHINQLAVPVMQVFLAPYLAGQFGLGGGGGKGLALAAGLGVGLLAGRAVLKSRRRR